MPHLIRETLLRTGRQINLLIDHSPISRKSQNQLRLDTIIKHGNLLLITNPTFRLKMKMYILYVSIRKSKKFSDAKHEELERNRITESRHNLFPYSSNKDETTNIPNHL